MMNAEEPVTTPIRYDLNFIGSKFGVLYIICLVLNFIGFVCIQCSGPHKGSSRGAYFSFVAMCSFSATGIFLICYTFHFNERFTKIPWLKIEKYFCLIATILYIFAACFAASYPVDTFTVAAFFGFSAACFYALTAFLKYIEMKNLDQIQKNVETNQQTVLT